MICMLLAHKWIGSTKARLDGCIPTTPDNDKSKSKMRSLNNSFVSPNDKVHARVGLFRVYLFLAVIQHTTIGPTENCAKLCSICHVAESLSMDNSW